MGSDGTIYRAKQVSVNQNPVTDVSDTYWEIAFANISDFYTQTQSDARYLQKSANLSDLTNTATARTNLSVYSQAQTYTKTEVDAKTAVATTLQAQQQTSNTVLLSALKLAEAFQGANQVLTTNGYQKLPGGLILQWGNRNFTSGTSYVFDTPFPTGAIVAWAVGNSAVGASASNYAPNVQSLTATQMILNWTAGGTAPMFWFALGK